MALISLQEVSLGFGGPLLLEEVSLQIERGEWVKATVVADASFVAMNHVVGLMVKKYDLAYRAFALLGKLRKSEYALKIQANP